MGNMLSTALVTTTLVGFANSVQFFVHCPSDSSVPTLPFVRPDEEQKIEIGELRRLISDQIDVPCARLQLMFRITGGRALRDGEEIATEQARKEGLSLVITPETDHMNPEASEVQQECRRLAPRLVAGATVAALATQVPYSRLRRRVQELVHSEKNEIPADYVISSQTDDDTSGTDWMVVGVALTVISVAIGIAAFVLQRKM